MLVICRVRWALEPASLGMHEAHDLGPSALAVDDAVLCCAVRCGEHNGECPTGLGFFVFVGTDCNWSSIQYPDPCPCSDLTGPRSPRPPLLDASLGGESSSHLTSYPVPRARPWAYSLHY